MTERCNRRVVPVDPITVVRATTPGTALHKLIEYYSEYCAANGLDGSVSADELLARDGTDMPIEHKGFLHDFLDDWEKACRDDQETLREIEKGVL